jgi:iron complex transport system ATP-binding protein
MIPAMPPKAPLVAFENVSLLRGGRRVLDGLSFEIGVGENVAILGPNGSGKSSLVKLLTRELYPLANGATSSLRVLGRDRWELFALRRHLGIVSADLQNTFAQELSGREAVLSGFFSSVGLWTNHRVTPAMARKADRALRRLEVERLADRPMNEMSAGEARRMLIGRALVHEPRALVLDEPMTSLDLRAHREFRETIRSLARAGTNVILVTHALEDVIPEIGRVVLLREGRLFRDGPTEELLTPRTLSELYRMPVRVERRHGYYHVS